MSEVVLYSAIFGRYDRPKPLPFDLDVPAVMFTEDEETTKIAAEGGWEVRFWRPMVEWSPMMNHKWLKLHPHVVLNDSATTLWIDGSMTVLYSDYGRRCIDALGDDHWAMVPHPSRRCIYDEANFSATLTWRYDAAAMLAQVEYYRAILGHPAQWGLVATGANTRRNVPQVNALCEHWWWENIHRSHQDQLSLPVLLRIAESAEWGRGLRWNTNLPWHQWWHLAEHDWTGGVNNDRK